MQPEAVSLEGRLDCQTPALSRERLDAIRNVPLPPDDELPDLGQGQPQTAEAFALREDR